MKKNQLSSIDIFIDTINPDTHKSELNSTFESDILLDPSRLKEVAEWTVENGVYKRAAKSNNNRQYRWPNKILRYKFERTSKGICYTH